jgi:hypothetical protein
VLNFDNYLVKMTVAPILSNGILNVQDMMPDTFYLLCMRHDSL